MLLLLQRNSIDAGFADKYPVLGLSKNGVLTNWPFYLLVVQQIFTLSYHYHNYTKMNDIYLFYQWFPDFGARQSHGSISGRYCHTFFRESARFLEVYLPSCKPFRLLYEQEVRNRSNLNKQFQDWKTSVLYNHRIVLAHLLYPALYRKVCS